MLKAALVTLLLSLVSGNVLKAQVKGEEIFLNKCAACHMANADRSTGPGLRGATERRSEEWLLKWVKNSQEVIRSGDAAGNQLFTEYNQVPMPPFALSDEEIKAIFSYVDEQAKADLAKELEKKKADSIAALKAAAEPGTAAGTGKPFPWKKVLIPSLALMTLCFAFLAHVNHTLVKATGKGIPYIDTTEGGFYEKVLDENRKWIVAVVIVIMLVTMKGCWSMLPAVQ